MSEFNIYLQLNYNGEFYGMVLIMHSASLLSGLRHTMASKTGPGPDPGPVSGEL